MTLYTFKVIYTAMNWDNQNNKHPWVIIRQ